MDPFKMEYPVIIEDRMPLLDFYQDVNRDDKFIIRCLEDIEGGLIIYINNSEKYCIFAEFNEMCVNGMSYKFDTDEKMVKEFAKYKYGYDIKIEKYERISLNFGLYDDTTKKMIILIKSYPYKYKGDKLFIDFPLDFKVNY